MRKLIYLGSIIGAAVLLIAAVKDEGGNTIRYRQGSIITFDPQVTIKDEDNNWSFQSAQLKNLAHTQVNPITTNTPAGMTNVITAIAGSGGGGGGDTIWTNDSGNVRPISATRIGIDSTNVFLWQGSDGVSTFIGENTGQGANASSVTVVGYLSYLFGTGTHNTGLGDMVMRGDITDPVSGNRNTAIGAGALQDITTGNDNTAVGMDAHWRSSTGSRNVAVGAEALSDSNADDNTAIGYRAGQLNTSGTSLTALGGLALQNNIDGYEHTAIGYSALKNLVGDGDNTALGVNAGLNLTNGFQNTAIGQNAFANPQGGDNNVALGYNSGPADSGKYNNTVAIGANATPAADNTMVLGSGITNHIFSGKITLTVLTNVVVFGGTNDAPAGSASTPSKWISVQVSGESVVYRLPLYQ